MRGCVGESPGEEEQHGWGAFLLGCADGREHAFEVVLGWVSGIDVRGYEGRRITTTTAGTAYFPPAAASRIAIALLFCSLAAED